jgi:hypothetical protein
MQGTICDFFAQNNKIFLVYLYLAIINVKKYKSFDSLSLFSN